jgi:DNA-binding FadR family transcriptional regulator
VRAQLRQPPIAELVAQVLRSQILSGALKDGDLLPRQEDLLQEFGVSKPSLREALRILETEGLITVQRGNIGGARVHAPHERDAAYMIGLVLQARAVTLNDVGEALRLTEPLCAGLCAARHDRATEVLPRLETLHRECVEKVDDDIAFTALTQRFHEELVACCGNQTMIVLLGALEELWLARQAAWAARTTRTVSFPDMEVRRSGLRAHQRILSLIEHGNIDDVIRVVRRHLEAIDRYTSSPDEPLQIGRVRGWQLNLTELSRGSALVE